MRTTPRCKRHWVMRLSWAPESHQFGSDYTGRISKMGDGSLRMALYDAGHIMLPSRSRAVHN
ncbi:hypothetical protein ABIA94_005421 [Bradyrhizobium sp. LA7.1]